MNTKPVNTVNVCFSEINVFKFEFVSETMKFCRILFITMLVSWMEFRFCSLIEEFSFKSSAIALKHEKSKLLFKVCF